jgi:putative sterol carrier protein
VAVFSSTEEAEKIFGEFFEQIVVDTDLRPKFVGANTSFRANYTDPESTLSLDTTQDPPVVKTGADAKADNVEVEMNMSADNGHKFWLGDLNIPMALARGKVKVHGPVGKLLKLLPAMQPAFAMYKTFLQEHGLQDKIDA